MKFLTRRKKKKTNKQTKQNKNITYIVVKYSEPKTHLAKKKIIKIKNWNNNNKTHKGKTESNPVQEIRYIQTQT